MRVLLLLLLRQARTLLPLLAHGPCAEDNGIGTLGETKKAKVPAEGGRRNADSTASLATDRYEGVIVDLVRGWQRPARAGASPFGTTGGWQKGVQSRMYNSL